MEKAAFQIDARDNVATALDTLSPGTAILHGDAADPTVTVKEDIPKGHKVALKDIKCGEPVIKYGVRIGRATKDIPAGSWVHLHVMESCYDERSSHLDVYTGAPKDTRYE